MISGALRSMVSNSFIFSSLVFILGSSFSFIFGRRELDLPTLFVDSLDFLCYTVLTLATM